MNDAPDSSVPDRVGSRPEFIRRSGSLQRRNMRHNLVSEAHLKCTNLETCVLVHIAICGVERTHYNMTETARALGLERSHLYRSARSWHTGEAVASPGELDKVYGLLSVLWLRCPEVPRKYNIWSAGIEEGEGES
jgi:hypothetical protein